MSKRLIGVILLSSALYLVGNARVSLWDRDEPRYAQASRQMLQSGDWVVPKLLDEPRINKPPMIYWLQASAMGAMRRIAPDEGLTIEGRMERDAAAARLPSAVGGGWALGLIGVVLGVMWLIDAWRRRGERRRGFDVISSLDAGPHPGPLPEYRERGKDSSSVFLKVLVAIAIIAIIVAPWVILMQQRIPGGLENTL